MRPPPALARFIVRLVVAKEDRAFALDDLDEEFADRVAEEGLAAARRWYRAQVVASIVPTVRRRMRSAPLWAASLLDAAVQDVRFGVRSFLRRPGFTVVAVATLAVAIGATTAIFSVVNGVFLKPVRGVANGDSVVEIFGPDFTDLSYPVAAAMARGSATVNHVAALDWEPMAIGGADHPVVRLGLAVTGSYFDALGVNASRGRLFAPNEATFPSVMPVAVISEHLRADRFADAPIPGTSLVVNGIPLAIIGVAGSSFRGHTLIPVDVYVPLGLPIPGLTSEETLTRAEAENVQVLAQLADGISPRAAADELSVLLGTILRAADVDVAPGFQVRVDRWGTVPAPVRSGVMAFLAALLVLVGLVLAMASVNVAGMVLSRSVERGDEIALRVALGAGRARVVRQLLTEATVLALLAAGLGLPLAVWAARLLLAFEPPLPPGYGLALDFSVDARVLAFSFVVAMGSALVFNLAPALRAARTDVAAAMKGGSLHGGGGALRSRSLGGRNLLVAGQMALSLVLLATAGLFLESLSAMEGRDPGWDATGVFTTDLDLQLVGISDDEGRAVFRSVRTRLAATPGVEAVGVAHKLPLASATSLGGVRVDGLEPPPGRDGFPAQFLRVSPGYFRALALPLIRGRPFTDDDDDASTPVTIVNRTMADRLWPGGDAVGKVFRVGRPGAERVFTVVGITEDAVYQNLFEGAPNFYYLPTDQMYNPHLVLLVRAAPGGDTAVQTAIPSVLAAVAPTLPVLPPTPLEDALALSFAPPRIAAWVSGILGTVGLLLGAVGVYGVTAFVVSQRVREIGIRMALGATRRNVFGLVLRQGMRAPLAGMAIGLAGAAAMTRLVSAFVTGTGAPSAGAFATAVLSLLVVAVGATVVPALRAARGNPSETLCSE